MRRTLHDLVALCKERHPTSINGSWRPITSQRGRVSALGAFASRLPLPRLPYLRAQVPCLQSVYRRSCRLPPIWPFVAIRLADMPHPGRLRSPRSCRIRCSTYDANKAIWDGEADPRVRSRTNYDLTSLDLPRVGRRENLNRQYLPRQVGARGRHLDEGALGVA